MPRKKGYVSKPLEERFWEKVAKTETCWNWTASLTPAGYGQIMVGGERNRPIVASRVAWTLAVGPIPDDLCVLHRCDNRRCVRPDHLFLGTRSENMSDMHQKGRGSKGPTVPMPKGAAHWMKQDPQRASAAVSQGWVKRKANPRVPTGDAHWMRRQPERVQQHIVAMQAARWKRQP